MQITRGNCLIKFSSEVATGFACSRLENRMGWTWTLTSQLGALLHEAERLYGPRDPGFTILGIEFGGDRPGTWYPGDRNHISIRLSTSAQNDTEQAYFQLAHEVVHLLAPSDADGTIVLEEGLAHRFSLEMSQRNESNLVSTLPSYDHAKRHIDALLALDPDAIIKLREGIPCFSNMTKNHLCAVIGACPSELAETLCAPFSEFEKRVSA
jgi:hypothetical protein